MRRSVVVTGGTGVVGRHLSALLMERGYRVLAVSRHSGGKDDPGFDITDRSEVVSWFRRRRSIHAVVHLAAIAHNPGGVSTDDYDLVNHVGTRNVLDAARATGVSRFVFMSTASVYGELQSEHVLTENLDPKPIGPYAVAKARAENYCLSYGGSETAILRPPSMYSGDFMRNLRTRAYVPGLSRRVGFHVVGAAPRFSLCAVENVIRVVADIVDDRIPVGLYNVCDGRAYTQQLVARTVASLDGVRMWMPIPAAAGSVASAVAPLFGRSRGPVLQAHLAKLFRGQVLDLARIRNLGYEPTKSLSDLST